MKGSRNKTCLYTYTITVDKINHDVKNKISREWNLIRDDYSVTDLIA